MSRHVRWLWGESNRWVAAGLIAPEQAAGIRGLYPAPGAGLPWSTILFSGLGAVVAGLGVILVLAYNWHGIPRLGKLGLILGGVAALHGTGWRLWMRTDSWRVVGEAVALLGTMLFGAGIWLVAQVYNIDEHFPTGFLVWGLGALAMAWAMPSVVQGALAAVVLSVWLGCEAIAFRAPVHWGPVALLLAVGGLAWLRRSVALLVLALAGFGYTLVVAAGTLDGHTVLTVLLNVAVLVVAAGSWPVARRSFEAGAKALRFCGWLVFLVGAYVVTFPGAVRHALEWQTADWSTGNKRALWGYVAGSFGLMACGWAALAGTMLVRRGRAGGAEPCEDAVPFEVWLLPLTLVAVHILVFSGMGLEGWGIAGLVNLVLLGVAAAWMARGCTEGQLRPTVLGSLLFVALGLARYFDLFESLLWRGLVFLAVGAILFGEGALYRRARRAAEPGGLGA
jgi:uncharacterized membrane protein